MGLSIKNFRIIYYIFLFTVLITLLVKEIIVQSSINQQNTDAEIINLTGRQRMLSQRVSKVVLFLSVKDSQNLPSNNYNLNTLKNLTKEWENTYQYIYNFSKVHSDEKITALYEKNAVYHDAIINSSKTYLNNPSKENITKLIEVISKNELAFLLSMDKVVFTYQKNAEQKIERLRMIEFSLFGFTVLLFLAELILVIYPAFKEILKTNELINKLNKDLLASESDSRKVNEVLNMLQAELLVKEKLRIFIEQAPNAIAMFDNDLNYLAISDKWIDDYRLKGIDIVGKNHYEIFPEIGDDWKKIHQECLKGAINKRAEAEFLRADGTKQWLTWDVRPWYKTAEEIGGLLMYTDDITLVKESEDEKARIQEILDKTSEIARIGTWEADLIHDKVYWSKITKDIHEVESDFEPNLQTAINFFAEGESRSIIQTAINEAIEKGISYDVEVQLQTPKGKLVWTRAIGQSKFIDGKCVGLYGVFQDINKIKLTEIALNQVNYELNAIFDASPIGIVSTSKNGLFKHFNKGAEKMLQYTAAEMIGKHTPVSIHKEEEILERQKELSAYYGKEITGFDIFLESAKRGSIESTRWTLIKKDGSEVPVELIVTAIKDLDNNITGFLGLATDISQRLESENKILESNKNLKILTDKLTFQNKQLASFAHITSHNLRSPVGNLNALLSFYKTEETAEDKELLMVKFEVVINHLTNTLNTLVDTLKIKEANDTVIENVMFKEIYDKTVEILVGQIMQTDAEVSCDFSKAPEVVYNRTYLESIFLNLLTNPLKYRDESRKPKIFIETLLINNKAVLKVSDNGLGIDLEMHGDKLFGLNKTFHRHTEAKGVGLYLTKTHVEAMGGRIYAQSEVNKGSIFIVEF